MSKITLEGFIGKYIGILASIAIMKTIAAIFGLDIGVLEIIDILVMCIWIIAAAILSDLIESIV